MSVRPGISAAAASDAYIDRPKSDIDGAAPVSLDGQRYKVFAYKADPATGFHATAYQDVSPPYNIIISYRGTDPDFRHHTRTMMQDVVVDYQMVRDQINAQKAAADAFTQEVIEKAQRQGISKDQITVAGHSLGGALAELEAAKFGLRGATFNGYGAVDLGYGVPEGGQQLTNYVMAGDPVSAASRHLGEVKVLASAEDVDAQKPARYLDAPPGAQPPNPLLAMRLGDHSITHFIGPDSVLTPEKMAQYERNYGDHKVAIDQFRGDMFRERGELGEVLRSPDSHNLSTTYAKLQPHLQEQLAEVHALTVDATIHRVVEHNPIVEGSRQSLDHASALWQAGGLGAQHLTDQAAQQMRTEGRRAQQVGDSVSREAQAFLPVGPVMAGSVALGAHVAGHVAHSGAEGLVQVSEMAGHATRVASQFATEQTQAARHDIDVGVHLGAQVIQNTVHGAELKGVVAADLMIDGTRQVQATAQAVSEGLSHGYDVAKHAVSQGIDAGTRAVEHACNTVTHPGASSPTTPSPSARLDQPGHPDHVLYLKTRELVHALDRDIGRNPDVRSDQLAAGLTVTARQAGFAHIHKVMLSEDGSKSWCAHRPDGVGKDFPFLDRHAAVSTQAAMTPIEQTSAQWPQAMQQFRQHQEHAQQIQQQVQQQQSHTFSMSR